MKKLLAACAALALAAAALPASAASFDAMRRSWAEPQTPFRVIGNVWYVGTRELAAYLIRTPAGDILIDGTLPETAGQVEHNIQSLGVPLSAVKILLNSHAHFDHAGGLAQIKRDTGAKLYAMAQDAPILEHGHIEFGPSKKIDFPPVSVDRRLKDGDTVRLGGTVLTAHLTPGHTPGCTSWTWDVQEGGKPHTVIDECSTTVAGNPLVGNAEDPDIVAQYRQQLRRAEAPPRRRLPGAACQLLQPTEETGRPPRRSRRRLCRSGGTAPRRDRQRTRLPDGIGKAEGRGR